MKLILYLCLGMEKFSSLSDPPQELEQNFLNEYEKQKLMVLCMGTAVISEMCGNGLNSFFFRSGLSSFPPSLLGSFVLYNTWKGDSTWDLNKNKWLFLGKVVWMVATPQLPQTPRQRQRYSSGFCNICCFSRCWNLCTGLEEKKDRNPTFLFQFSLPSHQKEHVVFARSVWELSELGIWKLLRSRTMKTWRKETEQERSSVWWENALMFCHLSYSHQPRSLKRQEQEGQDWEVFVCTMNVSLSFLQKIQFRADFCFVFCH